MDKEAANARLIKILEDIYQQYRDDGVMPYDRKQYFSGYVDALMTLGILNRTELTNIIEAANKAVFNMSLMQRRQLLDIKADPSMFDPPAWIRQGKTIQF